jgi:hypothetical protein
MSLGMKAPPLDSQDELLALTIIETAKLHGNNPEVYLTDILTRIQSHPKDRLQELLPWLWALAKDRYEAA